MTNQIIPHQPHQQHVGGAAPETVYHLAPNALGTVARLVLVILLLTVVYAAIGMNIPAEYTPRNWITFIHPQPGTPVYADPLGLLPVATWRADGMIPVIGCLKRPSGIDMARVRIGWFAFWLYATPDANCWK